LTKRLWSIIRNAYCSRTHHYLAIDALALVQSEAGRRLVGHLLRHHRRYLIGSTDPDERFHDYHNHVVHVSDGSWGGAPGAAHQWYDRLLRYLRTDRFSDAAHAAGVLSHYFSDPFQPFHTQSSELGAILHRPFEWSICQSYDAIIRHWIEDPTRAVFCLTDRAQWLREAILDGARIANQKYATVLGAFPLESAIKDPSRGIDGELLASMADLLGLLITGWARVLERAALDAETTRFRPLPPAALLTATIDAALHLPTAVWKRRRYHRQEQRAVEDLYDEFIRLGGLQQHLPVEVDVVQRVIQVHRLERLWEQSRSTLSRFQLNTAQGDQREQIRPRRAA
jgi:hypothetical protein